MRASLWTSKDLEILEDLDVDQLTPPMREPGRTAERREEVRVQRIVVYKMPGCCVKL